MSKCDPDKCKMCGKKGLPILLTRYAVATNDTTKWYTEPSHLLADRMQASGAPKISGDFKEPGIDLGKTAYYTQRLMRGGYVYVFDEKRKKWKGYFVTDNACLLEFDIQTTFGKSAVKGVNPQSAYPCNPAKYGLLAACITVEKAEEAGNLWIAFSDVQWTEAVWEKFDKDKPFRELNMRQFDVQAWISNKKHPHACLFSDVDKHIADFNPDVKSETFDFSPASLPVLWGYYDFAKYQERYIKNRDTVGGGSNWGRTFEGTTFSEAFINPIKNKIKYGPCHPGMGLDVSGWLRNLAKGKPMGRDRYSPIPEAGQMFKDSYVSALKVGLNSFASFRGVSEELKKCVPVVAINDVPGIAADLAGLMSCRLLEFNNQPKYFQKLFASATILSFKDSVHARAELDELERKRRAYVKKVKGRSESKNAHYFLSKEEREEFDKLTLTDGEKAKAQKEAWLLYSKILKDYDPPKKKGSEEYGEFLERKDDYIKKYLESEKGKDDLFDETDRATFQTEYDQSLASLDKDNLLEIARAHAEWMKSDLMLRYFQTRFDTANVNSGKVYLAVFSMCIASTQDFSPCNKLYSDWIESGDSKDVKNLLMRAAVLNLDALADKLEMALKMAKELVKQRDPDPQGCDAHCQKLKEIEQAHKTNTVFEQMTALCVDLAEEYAKVLFGITDAKDYFNRREVLIQNDEELARLLSNFHRQVMGPAVRHLTDVTAAGDVSALMFARTGLGEARPTQVKLNTYVSEAQASLLAQAAATAPRGSRAATDLARINDRVRLLRAQGAENVKLNTTIYLEIPFQHLTGKQRQDFSKLLYAGNGMLIADNYEALEAVWAILAEDWDTALRMLDRDRMAREERRNQRKNNIELGRKVIQKAGSAGLTSYTAYSCYTATIASLQAIQKTQKGTTEQIAEAYTRFVGAVSMSLATIADTSCLVIRSRLAMRLAQGLRDQYVDSLTKWGRGFGVTGIAVGIVMDIVGVVDSAQKRQYGLAAAHGASIGLGFYSIYLLYAASLWIGLAVLVISMIVSALISEWEDDPYRDWIGKCVFGNYSNKFGDPIKEREAYQGIN